MCTPVPVNFVEMAKNPQTLDSGMCDTQMFNCADSQHMVQQLYLLNAFILAGFIGIIMSVNAIMTTVKRRPKLIWL